MRAAILLAAVVGGVALWPVATAQAQKSPEIEGGRYVVVGRTFDQVRWQWAGIANSYRASFAPPEGWTYDAENSERMQAVFELPADAECDPEISLRAGFIRGYDFESALRAFVGTTEYDPPARNRRAGRLWVEDMDGNVFPRISVQVDGYGGTGENEDYGPETFLYPQLVMLTRNDEHVTVVDGLDVHEGDGIRVLMAD